MLRNASPEPRYHVWWGREHDCHRGFVQFDDALHEYKLHVRLHRDLVLTGKPSTAPRLFGTGFDGDRDGLTAEEREAVEAVS